MIDATIKITVPPEKSKEFLQTVHAVLAPIRKEQGCLSCNCYVNIETEDTLLFREEWHTRDDLESHVRSGLFRVLIGAMSLLDRPPEIRFNTIAATVGMEAIQATRRASDVEHSGFGTRRHEKSNGKSLRDE